MAKWGKRRVVEAPKQEEPLNEAYATSNGVSAMSFVQGIQKIDSNYLNNDILLDRMVQDSIIASALDMWTEDSMQKDPITGEIFNVELDVPDDYVESELSKGLSKELNRFLKEDLRMEKELIPIVKRLLTYGDAPVRLDFADELTDEKLKLKESERTRFENIYGKLSLMFQDDVPELKNRVAFYDSSRLDESEIYNVDWEAYSKNEFNFETNRTFKKLQEKELKKNKKKALTEGELLDIKKMIRGRWFTELIGHGSNIYSLKSKQKLVAFLDRDNPNKFIKPDRIVNFSNNSGKHKVIFEIGDRTEVLDNKQYYTLERGESFLENAMIAWQVLAALEDILLLTRMTRSILYRIFSVEVGNKGNKETREVLDSLKNKIKMDETIDIRSKIYNSSLSQVPLGDSIFIPTRTGVGVIDVKTVGGDVNLKDAIDLDYFKDKLFAGLRIPAAFLGFTESLPGGIGDTSLTRMDIRYSRTIARIQSILAEGMKDLCLKYIELTRTKKAREELPDFKIKFTSINSAEDASRADLEKSKMDSLDSKLKSLANLGIDIKANPNGYVETRKELIKQYFGAELLEKVLHDEKAQPVTEPIENQQGDIGNSEIETSGGDFGGGSSDIISGPGIEPEDTETDAEIENTETDVETDTETDTETIPPEDTDYNLG